jgi:hypothetical protein
MGMLFPTNISSGVAFNNSAGAALIAIDRIYQENLLPNGSTIEYETLYKKDSRAII